MIKVWHELFVIKVWHELFVIKVWTVTRGLVSTVKKNPEALRILRPRHDEVINYVLP